MFRGRIQDFPYEGEINDYYINPNFVQTTYNLTTPQIIIKSVFYMNEKHKYIYINLNI